MNDILKQSQKDFIAQVCKVPYSLNESHIHNSLLSEFPDEICHLILMSSGIYFFYELVKKTELELIYFLNAMQRNLIH